MLITCWLLVAGCWWWVVTCCVWGCLFDGMSVGWLRVVGWLVVDLLSSVGIGWWLRIAEC